MIRKLAFFLSLTLLLYSCHNSEPKKTTITLDFPALEGETLELYRLDRTEAKNIASFQIKSNYCGK